MPILFCSSRRFTDIEKVIILYSVHQPSCLKPFSAEYSQAVDFVERALFTYERCFIGSFNFTSGLNRLDFDRVENRPFFLALHRQVTCVLFVHLSFVCFLTNRAIFGFSDLQRRGCVRTAFEFARLLYSLDPWTDPHGALLYLDYLGIKCGMGQWLLDLWDHFDESWQEGQHRNRVNVSVLPGWAYARALALRAREDAAKDKVGLGFCEHFGGYLFVAIGSRS